MKQEEKVLDVLMYLFENYIDDQNEIIPDQDALRVELTQAGFPRGEINKAFTWLEELSGLREDDMLPGMVAAPSPSSVRCYSAEELCKLNEKCRGLLFRLEQHGVLEPYSREVVLDRIMALESDEIDLEQLKWVVLMVLFNQPGQEQAYDILEDWVLSERREYLL